MNATVTNQPAPPWAEVACNVAYPCDVSAKWAVRVFDTMPRFVCYMHWRDMQDKGAELRDLQTFPGPWVSHHVQKEGEIEFAHTCPTCPDRICDGGKKVGAT